MRHDIENRDIWGMFNKGYSVRKIAKHLGCDHMVIFRRLKGTEEYQNRQAERIAEKVIKDIRKIVETCDSLGKTRSRAGVPKGIGRSEKKSKCI